MKNPHSDSEPTTEVVSVVYKSNFWKFFFSFLFIITTAVGAYLIWVVPVDSDVVGPDAAVTDNSFFSSVGSDTKEALTRVFSGDAGEQLVEVIDVTGADSAGVATSGEEADESLFVADEPDEVSASSVSQETAGKAEQAVALCGFDTDQSPSRKGIVINEVAWMGGASASGLTSSDEWIELTNISGVSINVGGWQVIDEAEQIQVVLNGSVSAGGFYLLERSDDGSVPGVSADGIYSGALSNTNEGLRLFNDRCGLVDEVFANPGWPAGDASSRRTMQREDNLSWSTFGGMLVNGVWGTPRAVNGKALAEESEDGDEQESSSPPPEEDPLPPPPPETETSGKININTADSDGLQEITGVGPVIAGRIIDYRNANGPFDKIEDIKNVSGIGDKTFEKMRDQITV